ncbi:MAG: hypothetical protein K8S87_05455 [Planctomycetes bacterium]|nr:hypothetical protein [Planctomycetota bacterium]
MDMKTQDTLESINKFNTRLEELYAQIKLWLKEENIDFTEKTTEIELDESFSGKYKCFTQNIKIDDNLSISFVPSGIRVIGTEGKVELRGESGSESLVYLKEQTRYFTTEKLNELKKKTKNRSENPIHRIEGWHWLNDSITGKKPLFNKDIFFALIERIN